MQVLISRHAKATGSRRSRRAEPRELEEWLPKFRKVMPVEIRRA